MSLKVGENGTKREREGEAERDIAELLYWDADDLTFSHYANEGVMLKTGR